MQPTHVFTYRGDGSACPMGPADGTPIGSHSVTNHLIDGTVQAGLTYCYTVFVADSTGTRVKVGSTGAVPVPDLKAPPPASVPTTTPAPQPTGSSSSGLNKTQKKAIVGSAGGLLALSLVIVIIRLLRRRADEPRPVWGAEIRMSFTGLSASALIIPVIALAWVLVVTALVVFQVDARPRPDPRTDRAPPLPARPARARRGGRARALAACRGVRRQLDEAALHVGDPAWWKAQQSTGELVFANWPLYIDYRDWLKDRPTLNEFSRQSGIHGHLRGDHRGQRGSSPARSRRSSPKGRPTGYDIVVLTNSWQLTELVKSGWLVPLDHSQLGNFTSVRARW